MNDNQRGMADNGEMTYSGKGQILVTSGQWKLTDNSE